MHKYARTYGLAEKIYLSLKVHGLAKTVVFTLKKVFLRLYKFICRNQSFTFKGKAYKYFFHNYNNTWDNERGVEIALFDAYINELTAQKKSILEVGNVLNRYKKNDGKWVVVDKFEAGENVINEDILTFNNNQKYDFIFSISTMEHVGFDDDQKDPDKVDAAIQNIKSLLKPGGVYMMSHPLNYNPAFDQKIFANLYGFNEQVYLKRLGYRNWVESEKEEMQSVKYDTPYNAANGLVVCIYGDSRRLLNTI